MPAIVRIGKAQIPANNVGMMTAFSQSNGRFLAHETGVGVSQFNTLHAYQ